MPDTSEPMAPTAEITKLKNVNWNVKNWSAYVELDGHVSSTENIEIF